MKNTLIRTTCFAATATTALALGATTVTTATAAPSAVPTSAKAAPNNASEDAVPITPATFERQGTITVDSLANSGSGSLRAALVAANHRANGTRIEFAVAGTITLTRNLPGIKKRVSLDATTAPGYNGSAPVVGIDANRKGGLWFVKGSSGSQLLGFAITNARQDGAVIAANNVTVNKNYFGLTTSGGVAGNRSNGLVLFGNNNQVGINTTGAAGVFTNVMSGNGLSGVFIDGGKKNVLVSNRIGTNTAGTGAVANRREGVRLAGGANNNRLGGRQIGYTNGQANNPTGSTGTVPEVYAIPPLGNLISGNRRSGVVISKSSRNLLAGNFIGTNVTGLAALGNGQEGVWLQQAPLNTLSGCRFEDNPFVYYNVLSGNVRNGLRISSSDKAKVQANFFGIGMDNTTTVSNGGNGILVEGNSKKDQVGGVIPLGNVSAGNGRNGIEVKDRVSGFITFNTFGGLLAFKGAAPNHENGFKISSTGGNNLARTNVWSGNLKNGVHITGRATGVTIDPNVIGLQTKGQGATNGGFGNGTLPNNENGILVDGRAHHNTIGGTRRSVIPQNTVSGNLGYGVVLGGRANNNRLYNTWIGTPIPGFITSDGYAQGNQAGGLLIRDRAHHNTIGTKGMDPGSLISGNTGIGATLTAGTNNNKIWKDYIGYNRFGTPLANSGGQVSNVGKRNSFPGTKVLP